ncbi:cell division topological specificity factor MinE [Gluconacetobacter johannae DSM 13595]|uniref:Cell division topological specificity factor n=1 Tax=Gluconacetobacter johannae TaxID=112140 RepID=A0A7W4J470_9PROT|nr:cell division topological specificity factor MinE [Gluconacetobacter johannae]MBB2174339.1 cell division topological specificity factor MinE [Gluconacetobacter johannae]GBQ85245.1 cell division topological specificity factor MinE [Gluconacetobacter johannae DSM 13595]
MSFLTSLFGRKTSAPVARDRLQILLAHERATGEGQSDLLAKLHEEILEVIKRHISVDQDKVQVKMDRGAGVSMLEIDIEVPELKGKPVAEAGGLS